MRCFEHREVSDDEGEGISALQFGVQGRGHQRASDRRRGGHASGINDQLGVAWEASQVAADVAYDVRVGLAKRSTLKVAGRDFLAGRIRHDDRRRRGCYLVKNS